MAIDRCDSPFQSDWTLKLIKRFTSHQLVESGNRNDNHDSDSHELNLRRTRKRKATVEVALEKDRELFRLLKALTLASNREERERSAPLSSSPLKQPPQPATGMSFVNSLGLGCLALCKQSFKHTSREDLRAQKVRHPPRGSSISRCE